MPPRLRLTSVTIMAPEPVELAEFYARLLDAEVSDVEDAPPWAQVRTETLTVNVEHEAAWRRPRWPAEAGEQTATQHLDIWVQDLDEAVAWAEQCGARLADHQPQEDVRVLLDPAGHPFCLFS